MIAPPIRVTVSTRATSSSTATTPPPGEPDAPETETSIADRVAALVAKATTPEEEALARQREEFDFVTRIRAEAERETNVLRDLAMEQMKHDDEILKKWIALI